MTSHDAVRSESDADLVFTGGRVLTMDADNTVATGLASANGRILRVGSDNEVLASVAPDVTVIDLAGRTLIPGINDSHLHGAWAGAIWPATIMSAAGMHGDPHRRLLPTAADKRAAIATAGRNLAALGITSYTEPGVGPGEDAGSTGCFDSEVLNQYRELASGGELLQRVTALMLFGILDGPSDLGFFEENLAAASLPNPDPEHLRVAGVKIFADGIPPMGSAWTHHHYADGSSGALLVDGTGALERERNLRRMITLAHQAGLQIGVHATGDRSIEVVVDAVVDALSGDRTPSDLRHYVIHGDMATSSSLHRLSSSGMGINMQPGLSVATRSMMERALDPELASAAWPIAEALAAGIPLCLSSDSPVLTPDWRLGVAAAAAWVDGALGNDWETLGSLLRCYTVNPAWQDGASEWKGSLEPGKVTDVCVLGADLLEIAPHDLPNVPVDLTVLGGTVTFERPR